MKLRIPVKLGKLEFEIGLCQRIVTYARVYHKGIQIGAGEAILHPKDALSGKDSPTLGTEIALGRALDFVQDYAMKKQRTKQEFEYKSGKLFFSKAGIISIAVNRVAEVYANWQAKGRAAQEMAQGETNARIENEIRGRVNYRISEYIQAQERTRQPQAVREKIIWFMQAATVRAQLEKDRLDYKLPSPVIIDVKGTDEYLQAEKEIQEENGYDKGPICPCVDCRQSRQDRTMKRAQELIATNRFKLNPPPIEAGLIGRAYPPPPLPLPEISMNKAREIAKGALDSEAQGMYNGGMARAIQDRIDAATLSLGNGAIAQGDGDSGDSLLPKMDIPDRDYGMKSCCWRDNNGDGNCQVHESPGVLRPYGRTVQNRVIETRNRLRKFFGRDQEGI